MKNILNYIICFGLILPMMSCGDDDGGSNDQTARMSVRLVDAPGDYDAVFIDVEDVVIKYNGNEDDDDDVAIGEVNAGIYDLLELTGGVSVLLVDDEVPAGDISQIRLILGDDNSVVIDGEELPLTTPSAQQSGLKIQVNETLEGGIFYEFILDFDADKSIVARGNGDFNLKPVIRAETVAETGAISGSVTPIDVQVQVVATSGDVEISTFADAAGNFVLSGVPNGIYTVTVTPDEESGLETETITDVTVNNGEITTVGAVNLE